MNFKDVVGSAMQKAGGLEDTAKGYLDEYKKTLALLETFGFSAGKFMVSMGIPPEIHTSIKGSVENIREDELNKLATEHKENKLLGSLINALMMTKRFWQHVESKLTGVTVNVTLGILPKVTVEIS